jgi:predicted trehalose synthase
VEVHVALTERVTRVELESATVMASAHEEAEGFARRIALLKDELPEARQAWVMAKKNSQRLSNAAADVERWWEEFERFAGNGLRSLPFYKPKAPRYA